MSELVTHLTGAMSYTKKMPTRRNQNSMIKQDQLMSRRSKDRLEASLLILFCRFHYLRQFSFHFN